MDEISLVLLQSVIESELDDLLLDVVYDLHSSLKGFSDPELVDLHSQTRHFSIPSSPSPATTTIPIDKQTCVCPHCGQPNIVAIRFAYHLAKCLGVGRRSSRQAKHRIIDQVLSITALSDDSRSNGEEYLNGETHTTALLLPEDGESWTDSTSSSSHRRLNTDDQDYTGDFDADEDEDDWKPRKKKRRPTNVNINIRKKKNNNNNSKDLLTSHQPLNELDFHNCIIPLDKLCPRTQHVVIPLISSPISSNGHEICLKRRHLSPTRPPSPTVTTTTTTLSSHYLVRSPLNLVEDEQSSTSSIILFKDDDLDNPQ